MKSIKARVSLVKVGSAELGLYSRQFQVICEFIKSIFLVLFDTLYNSNVLFYLVFIKFDKYTFV